MQFKKNFTFNIGLSSIVLIFVTLCLVSFSILSLTTALADKKLSKKILDRTYAYYIACNEAETFLAETDIMLHDIYNNSTSESEYLNMVSSLPTTYTYTISDIQYLKVTLRYLYPKNGNGLYVIDSWNIVTKDNLDYDSQLHLTEIYDN